MGGNYSSDNQIHTHTLSSAENPHGKTSKDYLLNGLQREISLLGKQDREKGRKE